MRQRVLLVGMEIDLRASIARGLLSSGYAVELATDEKRALKLPTNDKFQVAVAAPGSCPANLAMMLELQDKVPQTIVLAEGPEEIARWRRSLPESIIVLKSNEAALISRVSEVMAAAGRRTSKSVPVASSIRIEDCKLDLAGHVFVTAAGREVALTRAESEVLRELARNACQVLSRENLRARCCWSWWRSIRSQHRHAWCSAPTQDRAKS